MMLHNFSFEYFPPPKCVASEIFVPPEDFKLQESKLLLEYGNSLTEASGMSSGVHAIRSRQMNLNVP
jgi:hypothetical protein